MKSYKRYFLFGGVIIGIFISIELYNHYAPGPNSERLMAALNLQKLPPSVKNIKCPPSDVITDFIINCTFNYSSNDLDSLMQGHNFIKQSSEFYLVNPLPTEFRNGGGISIRFNFKTKEAKVIYYME